MIEYFIPVAAYLLGSIPFGYLLVRLSQGTDIRSVGSGNIGATNVFRKSRWAGVATLVLDGGKGYVAVVLARALGVDLHSQALAAFAVIAGHIFTVWLGFRGGKGVATGAGAYLALSPAPLAVALAVFLAVAVATRYVSLASIAATVCFPLAAYLWREPAALVFAGVCGSVLIVAKHHANIRRLLSGTENKFAFGNRS